MFGDKREQANISRVRGNFPYSTAGEAGRILGLGGPHAGRMLCTPRLRHSVYLQLKPKYAKNHRRSPQQVQVII